jgi:hypothetical protein
VAAALVSQLQPVDVTAYHGVGFVIRSAVTTSVIVRVLAPYSQPACGRCDDTVVGAECYSGYMIEMQTTPNNQMQVIPWATFAQQAWGYKPPGSLTFDPGNLVTFVFAFDTGIDFDVCIDDVKLIP